MQIAIVIIILATIILIAIVIIILAAIILIVIVIITIIMMVIETKTPSSGVWQRENLNKHIHIIHYYMILISTAERFQNEKCVNIILHNAGSLNRCCALGQLGRTVVRLRCFFSF